MLLLSQRGRSVNQCYNKEEKKARKGKTERRRRKGVNDQVSLQPWLQLSRSQQETTNNGENDVPTNRKGLFWTVRSRKWNSALAELVPPPAHAEEPLAYFPSLFPLRVVVFRRFTGALTTMILGGSSWIPRSSMVNLSTTSNFCSLTSRASFREPVQGHPDSTASRVHPSQQARRHLPS